MEPDIEKHKNSARLFLRNHPLGTLATMGEDGMPQLAAVYFLPEDDFTCFFVTKESTRKYANISRQPIATFLSFDESALVSIELTGSVALVTDLAEVAKAITAFQKLAETRSAGYWVPPVSKVAGSQFVVCKLVPTMVNFNNFSLRSDEQGIPQQMSFKL